MSLKFRQRRLIWCTVSTSSASSTISFYICGGLHRLEGHEMQYLTHIDCAGTARALWRGEKPYQRTGADDIPLRLMRRSQCLNFC